ncbi:MAG: ATP-dependent zinc metalloprotease FtsH [Oscillospiraceae bacterium]|nr:ATP-dependent zinc metalloprotease FtsH [Oscillospiraceae bacterium]MCI9393710.1 ATP-dependent zinc metalloprotease FtsH [Oscillospiraceae bacterium]MCI9581211.1 ATP-dependent zinc metalloprotease FtsH [Oscillospiraceae bacterium]
MKPDQNGNNNKKRNLFGLAQLILWALVATILVRGCTSSYENASVVEVPYTDFRQLVTQGAVDTVDFESGKYTFTLKEGFTYELPEEQQQTQNLMNALLPAPSAPQEVKYVTIPLAGVEDFELMQLLIDHNVTGSTKPADPSAYMITLLLSYVLPMLLILGVTIFLFRGIGGKGGMGGIGGIGGVGKANAKVYVEKKTGVTFQDVAGQDEAKESLQEIIDILHNPQKYTEIGAKLPKGALLVGPPGTGKTLLAKAVAGEAGVPFFSISGSDFVEMFVGVGASRVRDLFKEASKMAPCIIFIDEIDTIGKSRDNRMGGNDEREQTLNQLLAELDGFDPGKGVIVLGATNRPEVLDKALLRPGRFDRRITIDRPNLAGRLSTLQVHTRKIKLAEDVDLKKIALATAGTVGADLANLVNEAALRAVRHGRQLVTQEDLLASFEFVIAGSEKKNSVLTEFEKKLVAYHEVGHAMVAWKQKNAEPVQKITIVPHTEGSLGYTLLMPEEDKTNLRTKDELMAKIMVSMGGRAAEQVVMNTMTNGASQDIQEATGIARNMVAMFGMSDQVGMMALGSPRNQYLDGGYGLDCAQDTAALMDKEVKSILDACYRQAVEVIEENREDMDKVVAYLLEKETITGGEMVAIIEGRDPALVENAYASTNAKPRLEGDIEPPAKFIHITSEEILPPMPTAEEPADSEPADPEPKDPDKPEEPKDSE